jgi:hypothetical protein
VDPGTGPIVPARKQLVSRVPSMVFITIQNSSSAWIRFVSKRIWLSLIPLSGKTYPEKIAMVVLTTEISVSLNGTKTVFLATS